MDATFALRPDAATLQNEAALADDPVLSGEDGVLMGRITLSDGGEPALLLDDDLQFLVPSLCLRAMQSLARDGRAELTMASWPGSNTLIRDGEVVQVQDSDGAELARFPYGPLATALHDCAGRFTAWVGHIALDAPEWQPLHALLEREVGVPV